MFNLGDWLAVQGYRTSVPDIWLHGGKQEAGRESLGPIMLVPMVTSSDLRRGKMLRPSEAAMNK